MDFAKYCRVLAVVVGLGAMAVTAQALDTDNDGIDDALDNCPLIANSDQLNTHLPQGNHFLENSFHANGGWTSANGFGQCDPTSAYQPCFTEQGELQLSYATAAVSSRVEVVAPTAIDLRLTVVNTANSGEGNTGTVADRARVESRGYDASNNELFRET